MENVETNSASRVNLASLLLGLVAGVTATVLFATYNERRFKRVTQTTRAVGDRTRRNSPARPHPAPVRFRYESPVGDDQY